MAGRSDIWLSPLHALAAVRGVLFPWVPVFIAVGIALWFGLGFEPGPLFYAAVAAVVSQAADAPIMLAKSLAAIMAALA